MEISEMLGLLSSPVGIGLVCVFVSQWIIKEFEIDGKKKVWTAWAIGFVLTGVMLLAGAFANFGAFVGFEFSNWKDWLVFLIVAIMSGFASNGWFDSKFFEKILNLIKK